MCTAGAYMGVMVLLVELLFRKGNGGRAIMDKALNVVGILLVGVLLVALVSSVCVRCQ